MPQPLGKISEIQKVWEAFLHTSVQRGDILFSEALTILYLFRRSYSNSNQWDIGYETCEVIGRILDGAKKSWGLHIYVQPSFFEESKKWLCSVVQILLKANGPSLCSNKKDPASLSKNIWILPERCGTLLRARCLLRAQLDTCEMLGDHRLISMYTTAFLREERLLIGLFIMDV